MLRIFENESNPRPSPGDFVWVKVFRETFKPGIYLGRGQNRYHVRVMVDGTMKDDIHQLQLWSDS